MGHARSIPAETWREAGTIPCTGWSTRSTISSCTRCTAKREHDPQLAAVIEQHD